VTLFGTTRTHIGGRHALIAPDGHMPSVVPGWHDTSVIVLVSPRLSAGPAPAFAQLLAELHEGARVDAPAQGLERFVYVLSGALEVLAEGTRQGLERGGYAFLPADLPHELRALAPTRVVAFERRYQHALRRAAGTPPVVVATAADAPEHEAPGAPGVRLSPLLPDDPAFDVAISIVTARPGAALPLVETHEPEHGLFLLAGTGILRLEDAWYPVREGDAAWLGPYCPQWFAALGQQDASYLLYKDGLRGPWPPAERV